MADGDRVARGALAEHVASLVGLPVWNPRQGHGSLLTFEFGDARLDASGWPHRGAWHLWIQMAAWRIEATSAVLAGCIPAGAVAVGNPCRPVRDIAS